LPELIETNSRFQKANSKQYINSKNGIALYDAEGMAKWYSYGRINLEKGI